MFDWPARMKTFTGAAKGVRSEQINTAPMARRFMDVG
jgi:hypothetical protein